jgi:hypothetical protein
MHQYERDVQSHLRATCNPAQSNIHNMMGHVLAPNSPPAILERIQSGRIGWVGALATTIARTGLIVFVQVIVATLFRIRGDPAPWRAQALWWTVYATLVDVGCLLAGCGKNVLIQQFLGWFESFGSFRAFEA